MLFLQCAEFAQQVDGSDALFVTDNYYMSPLLLLCLVLCLVGSRCFLVRNCLPLSKPKFRDDLTLTRTAVCEGQMRT